MFQTHSRYCLNLSQSTGPGFIDVTPLIKEARSQVIAYRNQASNRIDNAFFKFYNTMRNLVIRNMEPINIAIGDLYSAKSKVIGSGLGQQTTSDLENLFKKIDYQLVYYPYANKSFIMQQFTTQELYSSHSIPATIVDTIFQNVFKSVYHFVYDFRFTEEVLAAVFTKVPEFCKPFEDKMILFHEQLTPTVPAAFEDFETAVKVAVDAMNSLTLSLNGCLQATSIESCISEVVRKISKPFFGFL
jgi:hypothetical protein